MLALDFGRYRLSVPSDSWRKIVLEYALDAVIEFDPESRILEWNSEAEKAFGWKKPEVVGRNIFELLIPAELRAVHSEALARFIRSGEGPILRPRLETTALSREGKRFPMELTVIPVLLSDSYRFYAFLRELPARAGERRKRVRLLRRERAARKHLSIEHSVMSTLAGASSIGAVAQVLRQIGESLGWELGQFWRRERSSPGLAPAATWSQGSDRGFFERSSTYAAREFAGADWGILSHALEQSEPLWSSDLASESRFARARDARAAGLRSALWAPIRTAKKAYGVLELLSRETRPADPDLAQTIMTLANQVALFVERVEIEEELREAVRARDEFVSIASHELKTPLTTLRLQTELYQHLISLKQKEGDGKRTDGKRTDGKGADLNEAGTALAEERQWINRYMKTTREEVDRLAKLLDDMLDISRITHGKLQIHREPTDLRKLATQAIERLAGQFELSSCALRILEPENPETPPVLGHWDPYRIDQVVTNLATNAMRYGAGKPVELEVRQDEGHGVIRVRDQGIGIEQDQQERIFLRFERGSQAGVKTPIRGLGLGLYITRQVVEAHGGTITVESRFGEGSTFVVRLPLGTSTAGRVSSRA